jgi:hypothetical protein
MRRLPGQTGKICRSGAATVSALSGKICRSLNIRIYSIKNIQTENTKIEIIFKYEVMEALTSMKSVTGS